MVMDSSKQDSVCIRRKTPPLFLFCLLVIALTTSNAQITNERSDIVQLQSVLAKSTQFVVDTTVIGLRKHVETLASSASRAANDAKRRLAVLTDSLIVSAKDTLDASRQDSLRVFGKSFELQFASHESSTRQFMDSRFSRLLQDLLKAKGVFSACKDCENRPDFAERLTDFRDYADSLVSDCHDALSTIAEERRDILADAFESARDSVRDIRDGLFDNRLGDIEVWRYGVSRLVLSSAYASHSSYRGRDNGLVDQSLSPSVTYRHSSGLSIQTSTYWQNNAGNRWDNFQLTGGYEFRISDVIGGSLSYSHFWFNDSSRSELSVFTDNTQAGFSFDWPVVSIAALGSMNFGTASEFTLTTSIAHNLEIQQNSELTTLLRTKAKGKKAVTTTQTKATSSFGILDYEISLPVTFELGPFTLVPSATYIVPLNVVDASTTKSFINLEFSISLTIR
jgi:hypothetical protein